MKKIILFTLVLATLALAYETPNPYPRQIIGREPVANWTFEKPSDTNGWRSRVDTKLSYTNGILKVEIMSGDPAFYLPDISAEGPFLLEAKIKSKASGEGQFFWTTTVSSNENSEKSETVPIFHDGNWHDYAVVLPVNGTMMKLRFDPAFWNGEMEIDNLKLTRLIYHPIEISEVKTAGDIVTATVTNHNVSRIPILIPSREGWREATGGVNEPEGRGMLPKCEPITFFFDNKKYILTSGKSIVLKKQINKSKPFENVILNLSFTEKVAGDGDPPANQKNGGTLSSTSLKRVVQVFNPNAKTNWKILKNGKIKLEVAPDGSGAKIYHKGNFAGIISPLVSIKGLAFPLKIISKNLNKIVFSGDNLSNFSIQLKDNEIKYHLEGRCPQRPNSYAKNKVAGKPGIRGSRGDPPVFEGPVVRSVGELEQGLLSGVEFLGKNEKSSTKLDLVTSDYLRYEPDKMWITIPLMAFVTPKTSLALSWNDMNLQPTFATPNFYDGADDHRMSLRGKNIDATILVSGGWNDGKNLSDIIEWYVKKEGLPELPPEPRTEKEQWELCLKAINGPLHNSNGWGNLVDEKMSPRHYFSGCASLIWFMTGKLPEDSILEKLVFGGGSQHSLFFTGRANVWLYSVNAGIKPVYEKIEPDGSVIYDGVLSKGHFENTASGLCALKACRLLDLVKETGDERALTTGVKILEYMMRFRTPRAAQVWEIPMHTPDILASAYLVSAYVKGYVLTGKKKYLEEARKWAFTGLPFVYLWGNKPIMKYSTIAVYGATWWVCPNWMGLPVQWCGLVYADTLLDLSEYDKTVDWKKVAKGILIAGEQMQYPDGERAGCYPDSLTLETQARNRVDIGPFHLISTRLRLSGRNPRLEIAYNDSHRVVAPFPVKIKKNKAYIKGIKGMDYQIVANGKIIDIKSKGDDVVELDSK